MTWLALSLFLQGGQPAPTPSPWRVVDRPELHVGIRPAAAIDRDGAGVGLTVQVTANVLSL